MCLFLFISACVAANNGNVRLSQKRPCAGESAGKLYDLLNERNLVRCLEDSKQQVQLPGLSEHVVVSTPALLELMAQAHTQRSTGSTGANSESSRSHQVHRTNYYVEIRRYHVVLLSSGIALVGFEE
jgi:hypothetical protein